MSGLAGKMSFNLGNSTAITKTGIIIDMGLKNTIRLYRDSSNDVWVKINSDSPIFVANSTSVFSVKYVGKTNSFKGTGIVHDFRIGDRVFDLSEQTGDALMSIDTLLGATVKSDLGLSHINTNVWEVPPVPVPDIKCVNLGVGGNNTQDLLNRITDVTTSPANLTIVMIGTNDSINPSKYKSPADYKTNLTSIVSQIITAGSDVILMPPPPCNDAKKKQDHDYTQIWGDESTYDLNNDILPLYRSKMQEVASELSVQYVDYLPGFLTTYITADGTHLNTSGYQYIADQVSPYSTGYSVIKCFGDSLTLGSGATPYPLALAMNLNA
jgi:lysophospholipase L1-like esterase